MCASLNLGDIVGTGLWLCTDYMTTRLPFPYELTTHSIHRILRCSSVGRCGALNPWRLAETADLLRDWTQYRHVEPPCCYEARVLLLWSAEPREVR